MEREPTVDYEVLANNRSVSVARVALGMTLYLDEPLTWAKSGVVRALDAFLRRAPTERLEWYTTSMIDRWIRTSQSTLGSLAESLPAAWTAGKPRHLFWFRLVDDRYAPECWFSYREIDPGKERRAGFLSVGFPATVSSRVLADYAMEIAGAEPYLCGTAGYVASFNEWEKPSAFTVFHRWSKRFLGLDLEDPDSFGWAATEGLITTSWLTLIGEPLLERFERARLLQHRRFRENVEVISLRTGLLVRAGSEPSLGDVNRLQFPHTYAEVARALEPMLTPKLPEMVGTFYGTEDTAKWQRRLIAPEEWA